MNDATGRVDDDRCRLCIVREPGRHRLLDVPSLRTDTRNEDGDAGSDDRAHLPHLGRVGCAHHHCEGPIIRTRDFASNHPVELLADEKGEKPREEAGEDAPSEREYERVESSRLLPGRSDDPILEHRCARIGRSNQHDVGTSVLNERSKRLEAQVRRDSAGIEPEPLEDRVDVALVRVADVAPLGIVDHRDARIQLVDVVHDALEELDALVAEAFVERRIRLVAEHHEERGPDDRHQELPDGLRLSSEVILGNLAEPRDLVGIRVQPHTKPMALCPSSTQQFAERRAFARVIGHVASLEVRKLPRPSGLVFEVS